MTTRSSLTRRQALQLGTAGALVAATGWARASGDAPRRTPGQILGPYFPVVKAADGDADLTRIRGRAGRAEGQVVRLTGRVLDGRGRPIPRARITVWQTNARGRYSHPADHNTAPLDPNFEGSAVLDADAQGAWSIMTIKPAAYPDDGAGGMRAPHIHFDVTGRVDRLVTQMYFAGEPLNETDRVLAFALDRRDRLIVPFAPGEDGALRGTWDLVLREG
jgi:protocatechuate 3,4-dioxygenase beta subunit